MVDGDCGMRGIAFAGAGLFAVMVLPCRAGAGAIIFRGDFESGSRSGFQEDIEGDGEYEIVSSPEPVRAGKYSCRYTLRKARRVELVPRRCTAPVGSERWYGFSIFIPEDWVANRRKDEVVAQWHASPDRDKGENWRSPPLAVRTKGNGWQVTCIWDSKPLSNSGHLILVPYGIFKTRAGYVALGVCWPRITRAIGAEWLADDPRFKDLKSRQENLMS